MSLTEFLTEVFCLLGVMLLDLKGQLRENGEALRSRGPSPTVANSVVLTCELAGEFLDYDTDKGLLQYFRRHHQDLFPIIRTCFRSSMRSPGDSYPAGRQSVVGRSTCFVDACSGAFGSGIVAWPRRSASPTASRSRFAA
jgi:hypothetical protein